MSVDVQRIMDFLTLANNLWSAPLQIIIALVMLWQQLGLGTLAGVTFMVVIMPINYIFADKMKAMFLKVMIMKDKRVKLMNEILNGIKVFKLYAWETSLQQQVMKFRQLEIKSITQTAYYSAVITFSFTSAPFFVSSMYQYTVYYILVTHVQGIPTLGRYRGYFENFSWWGVIEGGMTQSEKTCFWP